MKSRILGLLRAALVSMALVSFTGLAGCKVAFSSGDTPFEETPTPDTPVTESIFTITGPNGEYTAELFPYASGAVNSADFWAEAVGRERLAASGTAGTSDGTASISLTAYSGGPFNSTGIYFVVVTAAFPEQQSETRYKSATVREGSLAAMNWEDLQTPPGTPAAYRVTIEPAAGYTFQSEAALTVTVSNTGSKPTGNLTVALGGKNPDSFTLNGSAALITISSIEAGASDTFTVAPNPGLAAGSYAATVTVSGRSEIVRQELTVNFTAGQSEWGISLSETGTVSWEAAVGYPEQTLSVAVSNTGKEPTGRLRVAVTGQGYSVFRQSLEAIDNIEANGTAYFDVSPITGLPAETYNATVRVSGSSVAACEFGVRLTVSSDKPEHRISLSRIGTVSLGTLPYGYDATEITNAVQEITVNNTGNQPTGNLTLALSSSSAFTLSATSISNIAAGADGTTFTVKPNPGLSMGTHTATVKLSGNSGVSAAFTVSVTVKTAHTVKFYLNDESGGVYVQTVAHNEKAVMPDNPTMIGAGFDGWYTEAIGGAEYSFSTPVTSNLALYAKWTSGRYSAFFDLNYPNAPAPTEITGLRYGDRISAPDLTREGYTIDTSGGSSGWYKEANLETSWIFGTNTIPDHDITLYAKWTPKQYPVTFDLNYTGAPTPSVTPPIAYGSKVTKPSPDPMRTDHTFVDWYTGTPPTFWNFDSDTVPAHDLTLKAYWIQVFTVTFDTMGGTFISTGAAQTQYIALGQTATQPADPPVKTGHTFGGWYTDAACSNLYNFASTVVADITLHAKWTPKTYSVHFHMNYTPVASGDTADYTLEVPHGETVPQPAQTRTGYTIDTSDGTTSGWYREAACNNEWVFSIPITENLHIENLHLYAKWKPNTYTVTFVTDAEPNAVPQMRTVDYGSTVLPPTMPLKTGYTFNGWYKTNSKTGVKWNFATDRIGAGNINLYGFWDINSYTVTFYLNYGSVGVHETQTVAHNGNATPPDTAPTRTGAYVFDGWYKDADCVNPWNFTTDTVTADIPLYAKWIAPHTVTFYWNYTGATEPYLVSTPVAHGGTATPPAVPTRTDGYFFDGWYTQASGGAEYDFDEPVIDNLPLYAHWTDEIKTVPIAAAYLASKSANTANNPILLKMNLTIADNWNALVTTLASHTKFVALDLSACAMTGEFDAGIGAGKAYVVSLILPTGATSIKVDTGTNWTNLKTVRGPNITDIGARAFSGCTALTELYIPSITHIRTECFSNTGTATPLTITMGENHPTVGGSLFAGVEGAVKNVTIKVPPASVPTDSTGDYDNYGFGFRLAFLGYGNDGTGEGAFCYYLALNIVSW